MRANVAGDLHRHAVRKKFFFHHTENISKALLQKMNRMFCDFSNKLAQTSGIQFQGSTLSTSMTLAYIESHNLVLRVTKYFVLIHHFTNKLRCIHKAHIRKKFLHTYTQPFNGPLYGTTWASQKKPSPTHNHEEEEVFALPMEGKL